jgi:hypothetical protein
VFGTGTESVTGMDGWTIVSTCNTPNTRRMLVMSESMNIAGPGKALVADDPSQLADTEVGEA